jgi:hypothetical protein
VNLAGAALALELLEELDTLRAAYCGSRNQLTMTGSAEFADKCLSLSPDTSIRPARYGVTLFFI